jgi:hypothetical protein
VIATIVCDVYIMLYNIEGGERGKEISQVLAWI